MSQSLDLLWVEKYRPTELSDMALRPEHRAMLEKCLQDGSIPHLLFSGPPGTGKTTTAKLIVSKLNCRVLMLNASSDRGIQVIRDKVGTFARAKSTSDWNIVFFDEADGLTADAQDSLRNVMESYATVSRFIFTCNHPRKIIDALQSRTQRIDFIEMPMQERFKVLQQILFKEGLKAEPQAILSYAQRFTDMRKMISSAQRSFLGHGKLIPVSQLQVTGGDLLTLVFNGDWESLKKVASDGGFDPVEGLREMFWAVQSNFAQAAEWRLRIGRAIREIPQAPDPTIDFLALCAELMALGKG